VAVATNSVKAPKASHARCACAAHCTGGAAGANPFPRLATHAAPVSQVQRTEGERLVRRRLTRCRHKQEHTRHFDCCSRCSCLLACCHDVLKTRIIMVAHKCQPSSKDHAHHTDRGGDYRGDTFPPTFWLGDAKVNVPPLIAHLVKFLGLR